LEPGKSVQTGGIEKSARFGGGETGEVGRGEREEGSEEGSVEVVEGLKLIKVNFVHSLSSEEGVQFRSSFGSLY
jgi:hypothetical protein